MADSMIERVARAIMLQDVGERNYELHGDNDWTMWIPEARAALVSMRDIDLDTENDTEIAMLCAGRAKLPEHDEPMLEDALACWQAMIDEALAEDDRQPE